MLGREEKHNMEEVLEPDEIEVITAPSLVEIAYVIDDIDIATDRSE